MSSQAMPLPWTMQNVPHAVLDILRGCNIRCRDCYNLQPYHLKPLAEIEAQLDVLLRRRKLHSVSIVGGEITLHPDLVEIVRRVRRRGLFVELFTNGMELTEALLADLKQAGANVIFLHIEPDQRRTDLPAPATPGDLRRLRERMVALVAASGIEVGLAVTIYPDKPEEMEEAVRFVLESPQAGYLLVTFWRDVGRMPTVQGDLENGLFAAPDPMNHEVVGKVGRARQIGGRPAGWETRDTADLEVCGTKNPPTSSGCPNPDPAWQEHLTDALSHREVSRLLTERFALEPFGYLGSNVDAHEPRWLSYLVASVHHKAGLVSQRSVKPTRVERAFLEISRRLTGRYPFYQPQHAGRLALHLLLNGLAGGGWLNHLKLLAKAGRPGAHLTSKRLLFQWPVTIDGQGRVIHCQSCPDAVVKEGRLVPLCISDLAVSRPADGVHGPDGSQRPPP
jgi:hypothetical protein